MTNDGIDGSTIARPGFDDSAGNFEDNLIERPDPASVPFEVSSVVLPSNRDHATFQIQDFGVDVWARADCIVGGRQLSDDLRDSTRHNKLYGRNSPFESLLRLQFRVESIAPAPADGGPDIRHWILEIGHQILAIGYRHRLLDIGYKISDIACHFLTMSCPRCNTLDSVL